MSIVIDCAAIALRSGQSITLNAANAHAVFVRSCGLAAAIRVRAAAAIADNSCVSNTSMVANDHDMFDRPCVSN